MTLSSTSVTTTSSRELIRFSIRMLNCGAGGMNKKTNRSLRGSYT